MKLCAYKINDTPVHELSSYDTYQLNGDEAYVRADTVPAGYEDISSIVNWESYGPQTGYDYKTIRVEIYTLVVITGWSSLTTAEKEIASKWFVVVKSQRDEVHTLVEQIEFGKQHHEKSREVRYNRHTAALMEVYNRLAKADAQDLLMKLEDDGLLRSYVEYGIEGTLEGDVECLMDFVHSRAGTTYASTGLTDQSYTPDEGTLTDLKDALVDIITNGNY